MSLPKTFNPFNKFLESLGEEKIKITPLDSVFAEGNGIGAFSFSRAMEEDQEYKESLGFASSSEGIDKKRPRIRQYAVETAYGYWVSEKFVDTVDEILEEATQQKKFELQRFIHWLNNRKRFIIGAYATYLEDCKKCYVTGR